jgi:hypothetical protein
VDCKLALISNDEATLPDIILPSLRSLTLGSSGIIRGFLNKLNVPALHDLQIAESFLGSNTIHTLASFLSKSGCQLQELCITNWGSISEESYRKAFTSMKVSFANCINYVRFESFWFFCVLAANMSPGLRNLQADCFGVQGTGTVLYQFACCLSLGQAVAGGRLG